MHSPISSFPVVYPNHLACVPSGTTANEIKLFTKPINTDISYENKLLLNTYFLDASIFASNRTLYPDKFQNMLGAPISLATITYLPYIMTSFVPMGTGNVDAINDTASKTIFMDGTEARLIIEFCRLRNCSLQILTCACYIHSEALQPILSSKSQPKTQSHATDGAASRTEPAPVRLAPYSIMTLI